MSRLRPPDSHYVNAASGWLDLGNAREAAAELDRLSPAAQGTPEVLEVRWRVHAENREWEQALAVGVALVQHSPEEPAGWIDQSYALHELRRTREAWDLLLPVVDRFPHVSTIPYNLACYACQMGDHQAARQWLDRAVQLRNKEEIQRLALADKDLQPLWQEIRTW